MNYSYKLLILIFGILFIAFEGISQISVQRYLDRYYDYYVPYKVYIHTDKSIYAKGEQVWISGLLLDRQTHQPVEGQNYVDVFISDADGNKLVGKSVEFKDGQGASSLVIPELEGGGNYYLRTSMQNLTSTVFQKELMLLEHSIPHFIIDVTHFKKYYSVGDEYRVQYNVTDHYNNPMHKVKYNLRLVADGKTIFTDKGKTDKQGNVVLSVKLPDFIKKGDLMLYNEFDKGIGEETIILQVPMKSDNIQVDFFPESGAFIAGIDNKMKIKALDHYGNQFPFEGTIINENEEIIAEVKSNDQGIAEVNLNAETDETLKLIIDKPYFVDNEFHLPDIKESGVVFNYEMLEDDSIRFHFKGNLNDKSLFKLMVIQRGDIISSQTISLKDEYELKLDKDELKEGFNQITLFDQNDFPVAEQLIYRSSEKKVINASTESEEYDNRSKVNLTINYNKPVLLTYSATDEYRLFNDLPNQNMVSFLNLDSETHDHVVFEDKELSDPNAGEVNDYLKSALPAANWRDIYGFNERVIKFGTEYEDNSSRPLKTNLFVKQENDEMIVKTNFDHNTFYLGSNPILLELLEEKTKKEEDMPYYKELLRSGGSIMDAIYAIRQYNIMNSKIVFPGTQNSLIAQGGALIVINGIRMGENIGVLNNLNPFDIEEIFVSTKPIDITRYTGLNSVGIVEITTKTGENMEEKPEDPSSEFESPDYENNPNEMKNEDDVRTTIHWTPFFKPSEKPESVHFFHSDIRTKVIGRVEGIDENGDPVYDTFEYESFNYSKENQ